MLCNQDVYDQISDLRSQLWSSELAKHTIEVELNLSRERISEIEATLNVRACLFVFVYDNKAYLRW